jgi:hypothetical protein
MLRRLKATIKDLDEYEVTDAQLRDDEMFDMSLALWKSKRHELLGTARGGWRTKEHKLQKELVQKDRTIDYYQHRAKQLENILTKVGKEDNIDFGATAFKYTSRDELDKLTKNNADLRAHNLAVEKQNDCFRDRNAELEARYKSMSKENDELMAANLEARCKSTKDK